MKDSGNQNKLDVLDTQPKRAPYSTYTPVTISSNQIPDQIIDFRYKSDDDFEFLLGITPTFVAQIDFKSPVNCALPVEKFIKALWQAESFCSRISSSFSKYLGYNDSSELIGTSFDTIFFENTCNSNLIRTWHQNNFSAKALLKSEEKLGQPTQYLEFTFHRQLDQSHIKRLWIVARDVTSLYSSLERAANAEEYYRTLVERPGIVLARSNTDGNVVYISPLVEDFIGLTSFEIINNPTLIAQLVHPEDSAAYYSLLQARSNHSKKTLDAEFRIRYKDGTYRWIYERQHPKINSNDEVEYYDSIILDINDRKQLQQQLLHAQRMETLGLSVGGIAHDFNNYLAAISGQIELAIQELYTESQEPTSAALPHLDLAGQAILNCSAMARRLLFFSRKSEFEKQLIDTENLLNSTNDLLRYSLPGRIKVSIQIENNIQPLFGNKVELQQVLLNLGLNARDAISGQGSIVFSAENYAEQVILKILDTGVGIPESHLKHLFDPYFTTKNDSGGSGLGLNLAYSIVQAHAGQISVTSKVGTGTEVKIVLPSAQGPQKFSTETTFTKLAGGNETILVVEDDPAILAMLKSALGSQGYKVLAAKTAKQAINLLENNLGNIDLVFLDYSMPGESGDTVIEDLLKRDRSFPVLLTSGYGENLFNVPVNVSQVEFIAKPYPLAELLQNIRALLDE